MMFPSALVGLTPKLQELPLPGCFNPPEVWLKYALTHCLGVILGGTNVLEGFQPEALL